MNTIAYLANSFPEAVEPYVWEEICELRGRGRTVLACSFRRPRRVPAQVAEMASETTYVFPLNPRLALHACWIFFSQLALIVDLLWRAVRGPEPIQRRARTVAHTWLGAYLAAALWKKQITHIHIHHGYFSSWAGMVAARILGATFSLTLHGSDLLVRADYLDCKLKHCQFCITVSEFNRRHIREHYPETDPRKILIHRLGIDLDFWTPRQHARLDSTFSILSVGRLHAVKNHEFLLRACCELKNAGLKFHCSIAGEGEEGDRLRNLIREMCLQNEVEFCGHVGRDRLRILYIQADVVVLTSHSEGIPQTLMEAMAMERTVLAPAITGIPELIADKRTGFLYQQDSLPDLLDKLVSIAAAKPSLDNLQRQARQHIQSHFNRQRNLGIWADDFLRHGRTISFVISKAPHKNKKVLMRILYCNKYNFRFSGTEAYLFETMELMRSRGHEAALFSMADDRGPETPYDDHFVPLIDFKRDAGLARKATLAFRAVYSIEARKRIGRMIDDFQPDVAHVRNIYHHLSPSILWELKSRGVPVLYHINDFKLICPNYNLISSSGDACERCKGGKFWNVVRERCYSGGFGPSTVLAAEAYFHRWSSTYEKCVDLVLAPSQFARQKLIENGGWSTTHIEVLPHFQNCPSQAAPHPGRDAPILYFGRLSAEKGVDDLLQAMQRLPNIHLIIAGDGPQRPLLEALVKSLKLSNVTFVGFLSGAALDNAIACSQFTVFPSRAYETMGKSILESYAQARAVVASDLGSRRELVTDGRTGVLYKVKGIDQLSSAIAFLDERPELAKKMGKEGHELVKRRHSQEQHFEELERIYETLVRRQNAPTTKSLPHAQAGPNESPRLRIAFIGGRGVIGKYSGIETCYEELGARLAEMGHKVTAYCRSYFTPQNRECCGMRIVRLATIRTKHLETLVHTLLSTIHACFGDCDVVHYYTLGPSLFSFLPRMFGKKTIVSVQGLDWQRKKWGNIARRVLKLCEWTSARLPNATIVVSRTLQEYYRSRHAKDCTYVPNGTRIRERQTGNYLETIGLQPDGYVLFLGRFSPEKNCDLLIEAFEKLDTPMKLVLAGGSSHTDAYVDRLRQHQSERVKILDWISGGALEEVLTNAALFVLPSDLEGLSLALLDAMGAGVCALASNTPENIEALSDAGFTFRRGEVNDLQRMLTLLLSDSVLRENIGRRAQARIRREYLWEGVAKEMNTVYSSLFDSRQAKPAAKKKAAGKAA